MLTAFDHIATTYDQEFTHSLVGMAQRKLVWQYLEKLLALQPNAKVLELNCGTGEDALWMAQQGAEVLATDISTQMVRVAEAKAIANQLQHRIDCRCMDLNHIDKVIGIEKFDLVFSNFGGLNCIPPEMLDNLLQYQLPSLLNKNGSMVFVVMPTFCLWETLWYAIHYRKQLVFRRLGKKPLQASLGKDGTINTWYYSPKWMKQHLAGNVQLHAIRPIGFAVPPSYLNHTFEKRKKLFSLLERIERGIGGIAMLASVSDHYLIHLQKHEG